jgi:hypothetical protein
MICQNVCPLNKDLSEKPLDASETFNRTESDQILAGIPPANLSPGTLSKLESLCLADSDVYPLLKRNLSLLLNK